MSAIKSIRCFLLVVLLQLTHAADRSNFKTCEQSSFCRRNRNLKADTSWHVIIDSIRQVDSHRIDFYIRNLHSGVELSAQLRGLLDGSSLHLKIDESHSERKRFDASESLSDQPIAVSDLIISEQNDKGFAAKFGSHLVQINADPFRIEIYDDDKLLIVGNERGLFNFEHFRPKVNGK